MRQRRSRHDLVDQRLLWWWLPEIGITTGLLFGWVQLANHTSTLLSGIVLAVVIGVPAVIPVCRRFLRSWAWCLIVRHRLRVCFAQFIVANQSGSLPLILLARPTPVGERVWVYLRPGLSLAELTTRLDKIAVACHASSCLVERASENKAAYLRFDIKRREVLTAKVVSPLTDLIDTDDIPVQLRTVGDVPTALDLPDVPKQAASKAAHNGGSSRKPAAAPVKPAAAAATGVAGEDLSDWL